MHEEMSERAQGELLDLDAIMQAFGLPEWRNLGPLELPHVQHFNLLVEAGGQRYVLRERPEGPLEGSSEHCYAFQRYLREAGVPVPALLTTAQGQAWAMQGEEIFELQEWRAGDLFESADERSLAWIEEAGAMLGRIHRLSQHYTGPQYNWPSEAHIGAIVQGYLNLARSRAEQESVQALSVALSDWAEQWEAILPSVMISLGAGKNDLPAFHIHGDYHAFNLRFASSEVSAVMGFEASRWEKRIFEVAAALFSFSALQWSASESLTRPLVKRGLEPERARHFLQAYRSEYPAVRGEASLLTEALMLVAPIASVNGPLEDLFYAQDELNAVQIEDLLGRLSWSASLPAWLGRVRGSLSEMWEGER